VFMGGFSLFSVLVPRLIFAPRMGHVASRLFEHGRRQLGGDEALFFRRVFPFRAFVRRSNHLSKCFGLDFFKPPRVCLVVSGPNCLGPIFPSCLWKFTASGRLGPWAAPLNRLLVVLHDFYSPGFRFRGDLLNWYGLAGFLADVSCSL